MEVVTYADAVKNLKRIMDQVIGDRTPIVVERQKAGAVVLVPLADWNAIAETLHLMSTPNNARRLRDAIAELDQIQAGSKPALKHGR